MGYDNDREEGNGGDRTTGGDRTPGRRPPGMAGKPEHLKKLTKQISFVEARSRDQSRRDSASTTGGSDYASDVDIPPSPAPGADRLANRRKTLPNPGSMKKMQIATLPDDGGADVRSEAPRQRLARTESRWAPKVALPTVFSPNKVKGVVEWPVRR